MTIKGASEALGFMGLGFREKARGSGTSGFSKLMITYTSRPLCYHGPEACLGLT